MRQEIVLSLNEAAKKRRKIYDGKPILGAHLEDTFIAGAKCLHEMYDEEFQVDFNTHEYYLTGKGKNEVLVVRKMSDKDLEGEYEFAKGEQQRELAQVPKNMKQINSLRGIDYKENPEGRLLFSALAIMTTELYPNKTPDEVVEILNKKADSFLPEAGNKIIPSNKNK